MLRLTGEMYTNSLALVTFGETNSLSKWRTIAAWCALGSVAWDLWAILACALNAALVFGAQGNAHTSWV